MERKQLFNTRLDENVIITMLAVSIVAFIIFAFRYKNSEPCVPFTIRASKVKGQTGELIRFETTVRNFKSLQWEFGDKKKGEAGKTFVARTYDQTGEYTVSLLVNDKCTEYIVIRISQAPKIVNPLLLPSFACPSTAEVTKKVNFKDSTKGATAWEWYFGENITVDDTSQTPSYVYNTPGMKKVSLRINHDPNRVGVKEIFVNAAPEKQLVKNNSEDYGKKRKQISIPNQPTYDPIEDQLHPPKEPPPVEQVTSVDISREELEAQLKGVANHQALYTLEHFYKYMCNDPNIPVKLNGKVTTFADVYNRLASLKNAGKIKNIKVLIIKEDKTRCIQMLDIDCYKKGFLNSAPL